MSFDPNIHDHTTDEMEFTALLVDETDLAYCVDIEGHVFWVGRSISRIEPKDHETGDIVTITIPEWLVRRENL